MEPVKWAGANFVYRGPQPGIGDLWTRVNEEDPSDPTVISVWDLSPEERKAIINGARVELRIYGRPMPPVVLSLISGDESDPVGEHPFQIDMDEPQKTLLAQRGGAE